MGTVLGSAKLDFGKSPKIYSNTRICIHSECQTVISRYNKYDLCWFHTPPGHSRIRGRAPAEMIRGESSAVKDCRNCSSQLLVSTKILIDGIVHIRGENGGASCEE